MSLMKTSYSSLAVIIGVAILVALAAFLAWQFLQTPNMEYTMPVYSSQAWALGADKESEPEPVPHLETPEPLKAVYMTSCVAGTPSLRQKLINLVKETELNAIVVDLKDYTGALSFNPQNESLQSYAVSKCPLGDLAELTTAMHAENIYVIGRVTVFQDPLFAGHHPAEAVKNETDTSRLWADRKGINYIDPASRLAWDHIVDISTDAYEQGVDELNFDYIRFPSDGNMQDIHFPLSGNRPKPAVLEEFFVYLNQKLKPTGMIISADVFGMTTSSFVDVGIGQVWERTLPHFDYVAPMIYPSHYYNGFGGYANPNSYPYEIITNALTTAISRTEATSTKVATLAGEPIASTTPQLYTKKAYNRSKIRPWLQDFDYPVVYTPAMVTAQIKATYDLGLTSWMMWDPSNKYTREVYKAE